MPPTKTNADLSAVEHPVASVVDENGNEVIVPAHEAVYPAHLPLELLPMWIVERAPSVLPVEMGVDHLMDQHTVQDLLLTRRVPWSGIEVDRASVGVIIGAGAKQQLL